MNLNNLTNVEKEFKRSLDEAGIPTTDEQFRAELQQIATDSHIPIANPSKYSAFWCFCMEAMISPARWLIAYMVRHVMPNMYVKTASGFYLDILADGYGVTRKAATKAQGKITFKRENTAQPLSIPAGTRIRTVPVNGTIFRMITKDAAIMETGVSELAVLCEAEEPGDGYNLGAGYYSLLDSDVPGITAVTNEPNYLTELGASEESDDQLRLRVRYQFASAGDWHTDAKYRSIIASNTGFRPDRIYFKRYDGDNYPCRGPGSADAYVLFDTDAASDEILEKVNEYIITEDNHGHGDDLNVVAVPESQHDVSVTVIFRRNTTTARRKEILADVEQVIRCAFRGNQKYIDQVTQTWPYSRFAFSNLGYELHDLFYEIEALEWGQNDIISELDIPRLRNLTISEG